MNFRIAAILLLLHMAPSAYSQIDPKRLDSLSRQIASQSARLQARQDSLVRLQDSLRQRQVDAIERQQMARESVIQGERSRNYLFLAGAMSALALLLAGLQFRKKRSNRG